MMQAYNINPRCNALCTDIFEKSPKTHVREGEKQDLNLATQDSDLSIADQKCRLSARSYTQHRSHEKSNVRTRILSQPQIRLGVSAS